MIKLINHNVEGEFWISLDPPFQDIITIGHEQGFWKLLWEELKYFSVPPSQRRKTLDVRNTSEYREWILHFEGSPVYPSPERNPESYVEVIVTEEEELNMETKTIKLINHNLRGEFYLQISGEVAERLISEAGEEGWWSLLYKDIYSHEALLKQKEWRTEEFMESIRGSFSYRLNANPLYLEWLELVHKEGRLIPSTWAIGVQGVVEEIVT